MNSEFYRPTTMPEVMKRMALFLTDEGYRSGLDYQASPTDTFIATFPKCGTTWMQQLVHCLRTRGDMDFSEITDVVPWLELSFDLGIDNNSLQKAKPQCFKSHLSWNEIPKGGRYIHITRNPEAVLLSYYNFLNGWYFETGSIDLEDFANHAFFNDPHGDLYWNHVVEWWTERNRPEVLFLCYEQMLEDPIDMIEAVAKFIEIELDDELLEICLRHSSADFMRQHACHFDDHTIKPTTNKASRLPDDGISSKISLNTNNREKQIVSVAVKKKLSKNWQDIVLPKTGLASYEALLAEI